MTATVRGYDVVYMERLVEIPARCPGDQCGADLRAPSALCEHATEERGYIATLVTDGDHSELHYESTTGDGGEFFTVRIACAACDHVFFETDDRHVEDPVECDAIKCLIDGYPTEVQRDPQRRVAGLTFAQASHLLDEGELAQRIANLEAAIEAARREGVGEASVAYAWLVEERERLRGAR